MKLRNVTGTRTGAEMLGVSLLGMAMMICGACAGAQTSRNASAQTASGPKAPPKTSFRPYDVMDEKQGMVVSRMAVPKDWKVTSRVIWNYNDFFLPVHIFARAEAPDGASWIEFFPVEFFEWLDAAHDRPGPGVGGIHHPNIQLPEAMARYVVGRNRGNKKNLRILGYRPVNNLPKAFPKAFSQGVPEGEGICMRVQYEQDGGPVEEEFYGFMPKRVTIPAGEMTEYHQILMLVHSLGAKAGKLEAARPLLGFVATSIEANPAWQKRYAEVQKMQTEVYNNQLAAGYASIRAAGERSRAISAQNDEFLARIDAGLTANRAHSGASSSYSASSNEGFSQSADNFDQYIRGTEHLQDQNGVVSDQSTDYNYHWTDGFGRFVHTDDASLDPNQYLNGNYQKMTPPR